MRGGMAGVGSRLMAKEPSARPASAADTAALLQAAQRATGRSVTRPVIEGERTAHLPKAALTAPEAVTSVVTPSAAPRGHPSATPSGGPPSTTSRDPSAATVTQ